MHHKKLSNYMLHMAVHFHYTALSQINLHPTASKAIERIAFKRREHRCPSEPWVPLTTLMNTSHAGDHTWLSTQWGNGWRENTNMKYSLQCISSKEIPQIQQRNLKTYSEGKNYVGNPHTSTESLTSLKLVTQNVTKVHDEGMQGWLCYISKNCLSIEN